MRQNQHSHATSMLHGISVAKKPQEGNAVWLPQLTRLSCRLLSPRPCRVLAMCHAVLYKQLSAWMLHGLLLDQHEEFFIRQGPSSGMVPAQPEEDEDDLGIGGLTGKQLRELQDMVRFGGCKASSFPQPSRMASQGAPSMSSLLLVLCLPGAGRGSLLLASVPLGLLTSRPRQGLKALNHTGLSSLSPAASPLRG